METARSKPRDAGGPFLDITGRKPTGQSLADPLPESEERFRLVANTAPVLIWMSGTDKLCSFFNQRWLNFTGRSMEEELGNGWALGVHPDDLDRCLRIYSAAFDGRLEFEMEYRLRRFDGKYRWIVDHGVPRFEPGGAFIGYIGSCIDITDRKLSEEVLHDLPGLLIAAHEEERSRIARELHDDLSQRMALLQIQIEQFERNVPGLSSNALRQLHSMAEITSGVSSDIHNLSHQLHPAKLDTLGLMASLNSLCREFSEQHGLQVQFVYHGIRAQISRDITLCIYRIAQEALRNVLTHSGSAEARVELSDHGDHIDLCVSDAGVGFQLGSAKAAGGLGLSSMRERARLVGGVLSVESEPSHSTRIRVRIPVARAAPQGANEQKQNKAHA
jgi:PAS domain S-box-containing protein